MQTYQERVVVERSELNEKIRKLDDFLDTETFRGLPEKDRDLLSMQFDVMTEYSIILAERIERFNFALPGA